MTRIKLTHKSVQWKKLRIHVIKNTISFTFCSLAKSQHPPWYIIIPPWPQQLCVLLAESRLRTSEDGWYLGLSMWIVTITLWTKNIISFIQIEKEASVNTRSIILVNVRVFQNRTVLIECAYVMQTHDTRMNKWYGHTRRNTYAYNNALEALCSNVLSTAILYTNFTLDTGVFFNQSNLMHNQTYLRNSLLEKLIC